MHDTRSTTSLIPAPSGWMPRIDRARFRIGWVASARYDINRAPAHVRAQATALHTDDVIRFWVPTRSRARRDLIDAIHTLEDSPRDVWLPDCGFTAGPPDDELKGIADGTPIRLKYFTGTPGDQTTTVQGFLRVESWTSIGMELRAYTVDVEPRDCEPYEVHLSEFGLVWDIDLDVTLNP